MSEVTERSDAKRLENKITIGLLIYGGFVATGYLFPPLFAPLRLAYKAAGFTGTAIQEASKIPEKITDSIAPDYLKRTVKSGDKIGPYAVGKRVYFPCIKADKSDCTVHPISGKVSAHRGVDLVAPAGTVQYVPGLKGPVKVECHFNAGGAGNMAVITPAEPKNTQFRSMHHIKCSSGTYQPGQVYATVGSTGNSTGPHIHWEQKVNGQHIDPQAAYLWQTVTGDLPKPPVTQAKK